MFQNSCVSVSNQYMNIWVEFKYDKFQKLYYYCEKLTHLGRFCVNVDSNTIAFECKNDFYGK